MEARKVGLYAATGILLAALMISGLYISGVRFPSLTAQTGTLIVLLTDAPVNVTHLNITIDSFSVHLENESWIDIPFVDNKDEVYFDLLELCNVTMELSVAEITAGNYTKMRMTIKTANATFASGDPVELTVPPGHIDIIIHFEIESDNTTVVLIDMEADWVAISENNSLRPVLKASVA